MIVKLSSIFLWMYSPYGLYMTDSFIVDGADLE